MSEDCSLRDEKCFGILMDRSNDTLVVDRDAWKCQNLEMVHSLRNVRRLLGAFYQSELVKYAVLEGTSVTFIGLAKYEADSDTLKMTHLATVLSGGMQEIKRCLTERIKLMDRMQNVSILLGLLGLGIAGYFAFKKFAKRKNESRLF